MGIQAQGKPFVISTAQNVGVDENGEYTNNSNFYRGLPYSWANANDRHQIDIFSERVKPSVQEGFRTIAAYVRTGQVTPSG